MKILCINVRVLLTQILRKRGVSLLLGMWRVWVRRGWGCIGSWCGNRRERDHWGDLGVDGWIDMQEVGCGYMDWIGLAQAADACECANEPSGSVKCGEFLE